MEFDDEMHGGEPTEPAPSPDETNRLLLLISIVAAASSGLFAAAWTMQPYPVLLESPYVWLGLIAFWVAVFDLIYIAEIREISRAVARRPGLAVEGVRILWLPRPTLGHGQASLAVEVSSKTPDYPPEFTLYFNLNFTWSMNLVGMRCGWGCKESGVLLLTPKRSRFLGGASIDSLDLPAPEIASIRGFLRPGAEWEGVPDWGRLAGPDAAAVLEALRIDSWLLGAEQPYFAMEAIEGRIEKWWPPIIDRLVALDAESALDLARIVRAFDSEISPARRSG